MAKKQRLSQFRPQRANLNQGTPYGLKLLDDSIRRDGWIGAITTAADSESFAGSKRLERSVDIFGAEVEPIVVESDGTRPVIIKRMDIPTADDERARRLGFVDNQSTVVSWNPDAALLAALARDDQISALIANQNDQLRKLLAGNGHLEETADVGELTNRADELQAKWNVSRGDIFVAGKHRIMCGDSTNAGDVAKLMEGEMAELLFTSPPYADMRIYGDSEDLAPEHMAEFLTMFYPFSEFAVVNLGIKRVGGEILEYWTPYIQKATQSGYKLLSWNIWNKTEAGQIANQTAMFSIIHEWLFVFGKRAKKLNHTLSCRTAGESRSGTGTRRTKEGTLERIDSFIVSEHKQLETIIEVLPNKSQFQDDNTHPATFPVKLPLEYILAMTNEGQTVIDSFLGSGQTLIACEQTGRVGRGMELEPRYVAVCLERLSLLGLECRRARAG